MTDMKWLKLETNMFDDEKIKIIESMPDADAILNIWIKLLTQAAKTNASGYIFLSENIPYDDQMLATIFRRKVNTVRFALDTFRKLGMINIDDNNYIAINNWAKHQNVDAMERAKEKTRQRVAKHREQKKLDATGDVTLHTVTGNVSETEGNAIELELERELERELDKNHCPDSPDDSSQFIKDVVQYLNDKTGKKFRASSKKSKTVIIARKKEGFSLNDFKSVIDVKSSEWLGKDMEQYLRPETLFGTKFEGYLNQKGGKVHASDKERTERLGISF